MLAIRSRHPIR